MISALGAQTIGPTSGGKVTAINTLGTSPLQVLAANPQRTTLTFHAPGTIDIFVAPSVNAQGQALVPSLGSLGGTFHIFAGGTLILTGEIQGSWQAFAASSTNQPLTIMESNV